MPKKDKQNKEPSEADPRASWEEGGVQESEDDKAYKDDKSEPSAQFISSLQSNFQAQLIEMQAVMQETFNKQVLAMQSSFEKQLAVVIARQEAHAKLKLSQEEAGPQPSKTYPNRQPEVAPSTVELSVLQPDSLAGTVRTQIVPQVVAMEHTRPIRGPVH